MATRMNEKIWRTEDGHLYRSVPTEVPVTWKRDGEVRVSGEYAIRGNPVAGYRLYRQGVEIGLVSGLLRTAKAHAVLNAQGLDRVNVA